jgi:hypothetical protein
MSEAIDTGGSPQVQAPAQPDPASQRAALLADRTWCAQAALGKGPQWDQLQALDRAIAGEDEPESQPEPKARKEEDTPDEDDPDAAPEGFYDPPESPAGYTLPSTEARQAGIEIDAAAEIELRQGLHTAGVSQAVAQTLYSAAIGAELHADLSPVGQAASYIDAERALRQTWGDAFDANLATANAEARRVFEAMPSSITGGLSFADWARQSGIANSRAVVLALLKQAKARAA